MPRGAKPFADVFVQSSYYKSGFLLIKMPEAKTQCNALFATLLLFHGRRDTPSSAFIREFFETARCDRVFDMSAHRDEYARKLTTPRLERILAFKSTAEDELVAAQATMHYHVWHEKRLLAAVSWPSRVYYCTVLQVERALARMIVY